MVNSDRLVSTTFSHRSLYVQFTGLTTGSTNIVEGLKDSLTSSSSNVASGGSAYRTLCTFLTWPFPRFHCIYQACVNQHQDMDDLLQLLDHVQSGSFEKKRKAAEDLPRYIQKVQEMQDDVVNAVYDLCEDPSAEVSLVPANFKV